MKRTLVGTSRTQHPHRREGESRPRKEPAMKLQISLVALYSSVMLLVGPAHATPRGATPPGATPQAARTDVVSGWTAPYLPAVAKKLKTRTTLALGLKAPGGASR